MPSWPITAIRDLLAPTVAHMGFEIYSIEQTGPGGLTLRIAIDRAEGVTLDNCQSVSDVVGPLLDQADLVSVSYVLEVSSPGAERPLTERRHYERGLGKRVNARYRVGPGEGVIEGLLVRVDEEGITIEGREGKLGTPGKPVFVDIDWPDLLTARHAVAIGPGTAGIGKGGAKAGAKAGIVEKGEP